jgi:catechol 2,3-dioxygenase-like lactoylglutathione lyase family enzyme
MIFRSTTMILAVDHIQLAIPEGAEDQARAFYVDILGFTEIPKPAALANRGGAWFQAGGVQLHLGVDHDFHAARKAHPAFAVDNLDVLLETVQRAGYEWDLSQPELEGFKRVHVFDPFGNRIELMERL